jgi:hypothetical protein
MSSPAKLIEFLRVQRVESSLRRKTGTVVAEREHGDGTCETIVREEQKLQRWLRIDTRRDHSWVSLQYNEPLQV